MKIIVFLLRMIFVIPLGLVNVAAAADDNNTITRGEDITLPGCQRECGGVTVPYPFGIGPNCSIHQSFDVECSTNSTPPKPILVIPNNNLEITGISDSQVRIRNDVVSYTCYNDSKVATVQRVNSLILDETYFSLSKVNRLTTIGCDDVSAVEAEGYGGRYFGSGCATLCNKIADVTAGECSGASCCRTDIPNGLQALEWAVVSLFNHSKVLPFNPCGYAFLGDVERFQFGGSPDLNDRARLTNRISNEVPLVLDWGIGGKTCSDNPPCYANSSCVNTNDTTAGFFGYRCQCFNGFEGNPYLSAGCRDINECAEPHPYPCAENSRCENQLGTYKCSCKKGYVGDASKYGQGCFAQKDQLSVLGVALGITVGLLGMVLGGSWIYFSMKKRKVIKQKEKFFQRNGGFILKQHASNSQDAAQIFTAKELELATNNYADDRILGKGGYGTVYKGVLTGNSVVAIKKSRIMDQSQIELFINEVVILTQVNHRNVVKLIGCCLETEVPLLVYEFVSNGDLFHHIHNSRETPWFSWDSRLRIAVESAGALAYLHSSASQSVIHRDVKSPNILLDDFHTAKISDFGASRLVPLNQTQVTTLVQGTLGYLDPEYFLTSQLTEKSDVYSFGVVLAELMTERKPLLTVANEDERNLAMVFLVSLKNNRLLEIVAPRVRREGNVEQIHGVAEVVRRCLKLKGEERPTMKEVAAELDRLRKGGNLHPWDNDKDGIGEENVALISGQYSSGDIYSMPSFSSECGIGFSIPKTPR